MTQDQPLLAVQEALKQCFPVVEEQQGLWQSALSDCQPLLLSLSNLAEQLQAAQNLRFEDVPPLRAFPDLKERLRRKQLWAGDTVLDKLEERLTALLKVRDTVSSHVERVLQTYEQHADTIGMDGVLQASVVSPSVADMLEWLQDIERHYRNSYLKRKCLLSSIQWGDLANIQALPKAWDRISEDEHQTLVQARQHGGRWVSSLNTSPCFPEGKTAPGTRTGKQVGVRNRLEVELSNVKPMLPRK
ncbi:uncharacterized protein C1orf109 homolog isoform X2 [Felis catus]|uniref:uncharacterized protein C1orf109 homolog isoform X2 n=1 Tax=Felis catus TaxID=9685 RepID=UPI001D199CA8|nr:uncharacterized protein C1orf109 homolog isoform X2 [Felis catus]